MNAESRVKHDDIGSGRSELLSFASIWPAKPIGQHIERSLDLKRRSHILLTIATTFATVLSVLVLLPSAAAVAASAPTTAATAAVPHQNLPASSATGARPHGTLSPAVVNSGNNVVFRGGTVLDNNTSIYAIFWEPSNNVAPGYNQLINQFLGDVTTSPLYQIANQYGDFSTLSPTGTRLAGSWVDNGAYPQNPLLDNNIQQEIGHAKQINGWSSNVNNIFLVFTQRDENICFDSSQSTCASNSFCSYHSFAAPDVVYAVLPYGASGLPCSPGSSPNNNDADSTINQTAGNIFGASTDASPPRSAWTDNSGQEIDNKCDFQFGPRDALGGDTVLNGHDYIVQELWDNYTASCRMTASSTILPGTWPRCSNENGTCNVGTQETVSFGSTGRYEYFDLAPRSLPCNTGTLGDPTSGTYKACYTEDLPPGNNAWTLCSAENTLCSFNGSTLTVAYGANGSYHYGTITNGITCNNSNFGDPANGVVKSCYIMAPPPGTVTWTTCATDNQTCFFFTGVGGTHEVAYGANGHYVYRNITATPTSGVPCNTSIFGDPAPGVAKACYWASTAN
jgi:hypothetical protein